MADSVASSVGRRYGVVGGSTSSHFESVKQQAMIKLQGMAGKSFAIYTILKIILFCGIYLGAFFCFSLY